MMLLEVLQLLGHRSGTVKPGSMVSLIRSGLSKIQIRCGHTPLKILMGASNETI
jgi:hypothetical protein